MFDAGSEQVPAIFGGFGGKMLVKRLGVRCAALSTFLFHLKNIRSFINQLYNIYNYLIGLELISEWEMT